MTDAVAKAKDVAAKHAKRIAKLRAEIAAREKSGRGVKALAAARLALAKVEHRAARHAAAVAPMLRRLDKFAAAAPAVMDRWKTDRKEEPKKLNKRIKALRRRVTIDLRNDPADTARAHFGIKAREREKPAPMIEAATWPSGPIIPYVLPEALAVVDRPGLEIGDYRIIARHASTAVLGRPDRWTAAYVGMRLGEAHATLRRLPMKTRPAEFGSAMPEYIHEGVELAYQAGAGTLFKNRGTSRQIFGTGANEVARMNEALAWPLEFLSKHPAHAFAVNEWAFWRDLDEDEAANAFGLLTQQALEFIAAKLNAKGRPVT